MCSESNQSSAAVSFLLPKKYIWYPNKEIISPKCSRLSISPSPKVISSFKRRVSAAVSNNPYQRVSGQYKDLNRRKALGQVDFSAYCTGSNQAAAHETG